jgi:hypothetical protein
MPKTKAKSKKKRVTRRNKYCPVCKEEVAMSLIRKTDAEDDLYWLRCPDCDSKFALTSQQYFRSKRPKISAIKKTKAKSYCMDATYAVGETIYHGNLNDIGIIVDKAAAPLSSCSGAIIVSFLKAGRKKLVEGYALT